MSTHNTKHVFSTQKKGEQPMTTKAYGFTKNKPNQHFHIVGFGQGGGNIANEFGRFRKADGKRSYEVMAINTNKSDLTTLDNISENNKIWFGQDDYGSDFNGFGKNAEAGTRKLRTDKNAQKILDDLINNRLGKDEIQHIVFVACEGGGTGTSVLDVAVEKFYEAYRAPIQAKARTRLIELRDQLIGRFGKEAGLAEFEKRTPEVTEKMNHFIEQELAKKRLSIIITVPTRSDGGDVLRQVSNYTAALWEKALDKKYDISNLIVVDNQYLEDEYEEQDNKQADVFTYINQKVASIIHELNIGSAIGDTNKVLDGKDFETVWNEKQGALFLSKSEKHANKVQNESDIVEMFVSTFKKPHLHGNINYLSEKNDSGKQSAKMIHSALLFAVVPDKTKYNGVKFLMEASNKFQDELYTSETTRMYSGFIEDKTINEVVVYVMYKIEGLPERLEIGLVKEYEEYKAKRENINFDSSSVQKIGAASSQTAFGSLDDLLNDTPTSNNSDDIFSTSSLLDRLDDTDTNNKPKDKAEEAFDFIKGFDF